MRWAVLLVLSAVTALAQEHEVTPTPPINKEILFRIAVANDQREFQIGERIPIELSFSSDVKNRYWLDMATYDRSGRMEYEHFTVTPSEGTIDPLADDIDRIKIGGGLTNFDFLTKQPWTIRVTLNEWIRFNKPGEYKLRVSSERIEKRAEVSPTTPVTAISNEITLKIILAKEAWQERIYKEALAVIRKPVPSEPRMGDPNLQRRMKEFDQTKDAHHHALETLSFLGTAQAVRELANEMRHEDSLGIDFDSFRGLISSPERAVVREELGKQLSDPSCPMRSGFLYVLQIVNAKSANLKVDSPEARKSAVEMLLRALPNKQGEALQVSLFTAVDEGWDKSPPTQQTQDRSVAQLLSIFDQLPLSEQASLLEEHWDKIKSPALLPILKRYAQDERDTSALDTRDELNLSILRFTSLKHWSELDPVGARPAIVREICRAPWHLRSGQLATLLPDRTLPEVDNALADHFIEAKDFGSTEHFASLITRYATAAILPRILDVWDKRKEKWACEIENPILAYILRVDPQAARPRIEKATAVHSKDQCSPLNGVAAIYYDPILEQIAIDSVKAHGASAEGIGVLGKFGSPSAKALLWQEYERWRKRWAGREAELNLAELKDGSFNDGATSVNVEAAGDGHALFEALATGQGWLADPAMLRQLSQMSKLPTIQRDVSRYLEDWSKSPLSLSFFYRSGPDNEHIFQANVAQYELDSIERLKEKLSQFPAGTKFETFTPSDDADRRLVAELRDFLKQHGMSLVEKRAEPEPGEQGHF